MVPWFLFFLRRAFVAALSVAATGVAPAHAVDAGAIERRHGGRLGVFVLDTGSGRTLGHRANERFAMQSTFKGVLAALVLSRIDSGADGLERIVQYRAKNLRPAFPVTTAHLAEGRMTAGASCRAILERSDNVAANLLLARVGGPAALTALARRLGDPVTRFDSYEMVTSSRTTDSTTPRSIAGLARTMVLGDALRPPSARRWRGG